MKGLDGGGFNITSFKKENNTQKKEGVFQRKV